MRRIVTVIVSLALVGGLAAGALYLYITRDIAGPTGSVQDSVEQLDTADAGASNVVFRISQDESTAEFVIDEVLNGADKTVVGTTDQVAGDILVDLTDPSQSQIGEIRINARTFRTDDDRRNNAIARLILRSEDAANEYIVFEPTAIEGLPESIGVGDTVQTQVTGDLTIAGQTREVTFDVTATLVSESALRGTAETTVAYADFGISIPRVPFVASVEDRVVLRLNFVGEAVSGGA